jgi:serpin B
VYVKPETLVAGPKQTQTDVRSFGSVITRLSLSLDRASRSAVTGRNENLLVAPTGLFVTLSLLYEGSRGRTRAELASMLGLESATVSLAQGNPELSNVLRSYPEATLDIATSFWLQSGLTVTSAFRGVATGSYGAQIETLDFTANRDSALRRINSWANNHNHFVPPAIAQLPIHGKVGLVAVNSVSFRGQWAVFSRNRTMTRTFRAATGAEVEVPTMLTKGMFEYARTPLGRSILLPFADTDLSLLIMLPEDQKWFSKPLPDGFLDVCTREMQFQTIDLELPRLDLQQALDWAPLLRRLGLSGSLNRGLTFDAIVEESRLNLSAIGQTVRVRVEEESSELNRVRGSGLSTLSDERPVVDFRINRPFLLILRHDRPDVTLLWARIGFL